MAGPPLPKARNHVVAIGIDQYRSWNRLQNAVNDARGAVEAFKPYGFEEFRTLYDAAATNQALQNLVAVDLQTLGSEDSLVLFFAGHGHTTSGQLHNKVIKQGYLIPYDAEPEGGKTTTWLNLKSWLDAVAKLPAKHILVILDACHSGIALDPDFLYRSAAPIVRRPLPELRKRPSRRILASALDHQRALDGGPHAGHSLFTGSLIEGLAGCISLYPGQRAITGADIGQYVQHRVSSYHTPEDQTPIFGTLQHDQHGQLVIDLPANMRRGPWLPGPKNSSLSNVPALALPQAEGVGPTPNPRPNHPPAGLADAKHLPSPEPVAPNLEPVLDPIPQPPDLIAQPSPSRPSAPELDAFFVAKLDKHDKARLHEHVLSIVAGDPTSALTGWGTWSANHGWLTLVSEESERESVIRDVLDQVPWMRLLPAARTYFANAAHMNEQTLDAALNNKQSSLAREAWVKEKASRERIALIAGWILTSYRESWPLDPMLTPPPAERIDLLSALAELHAPVSILLHHHTPSAAWLEQAICTASEMIACLPRHAIAVAAPTELIQHVLREHHGPAFALAKKGVVALDPIAHSTRQDTKPTAEESLVHALTANPRTAHLFRSNISVKTPSNLITARLYAEAVSFAIQIEDWYHGSERLSYRRDRKRDRLLQDVGIFVTRFLAEDIEHRLERVVEEIALGVTTRRAADSHAEKTP